MRRLNKSPRYKWQDIVAKTGLTYHTLSDGSPYWDESAYWEFTAVEINRIESATAEIQRICLEAGDKILDDNRLEEMHIPPMAAAKIRETWNSEPPALYGRLDFAYDGRELKLLEYNADTPTALIEAAVTQWYWLEECFTDADQFNSLHDKLVAKWKDLKPYLKQPVYFAHAGFDEEAMTIAYLRDTAEQAGHKSHGILMKEIGWDNTNLRFVDLDNHQIQSLFKLYPWEWLLREDFGEHAIASMGAVNWIEPIWKMLWSNKALLAILWDLYPNHELLLPAYMDGPRTMDSYVRKPLFGREGAGIELIDGGHVIEGKPSEHADDVYVFQRRASLATAGDSTAVIGSWLIDGEPAGMGIRESNGIITSNTSRFVPHLFR